MTLLRRSNPEGVNKYLRARYCTHALLFQEYRLTSILQRPEVVDSRSSDEDRYLSKKARRKKERAAPLLSAQSVHRPENTNDKAHHRDEKAWPPHAQLYGNNLKDQHPLIRELCRDAIKIVHITLLTSHAWPELNHLAEYRRKILDKAAKTSRTY